jgi:PTH2 family peptidyl-tRNA hydrolase
MPMTTKQVIVIRKDLKMRRGKEIAQGSHASMAFLTRRINQLCTKLITIVWHTS